MVVDGETMRREAYPVNGWSSWWGGSIGNPYPSALPYGLYVECPEATGVFRPYIRGVKFLVESHSLRTERRYLSTFKPVGSTITSRLTWKYELGIGGDIQMLWYSELGVPLYFLISFWPNTWVNTRKPLFVPGPGQSPPPLFSHIGNIVKITPLNRRGYEQWT